MKKNKYVFFIFASVFVNARAEDLLLRDVPRFLQENNVKIKIENEKVNEAKDLKTSLKNNFIPELKIFGGIKSDEQKLEFKEEHYLGIRSELTLFDGGIRNLENNYSDKSLQMAEVNKNVTQLELERFLTLSLFEEVSINEKIGHLTTAESKQKEVLSKAKGKKSAGILSETAVKEIEFILLSTQQKNQELKDKLLSLKKERELFLGVDDNINALDDFNSAYNFLMNNSLFNKRLSLQKMETETELDLDRIENQKERKILKPTIKAFAEKGLTRKIDGKYLEGDHQDRLVFGLNFEIPLIEEGARNIQELYAKKTREKILELKAQYEQTAMSKEHELNGIKKYNLNREIQRKEEKLKMYESLLKLSWNDVVRGQKEINDYSEDLDEYLNEKLELIDHKVEQVKELF